MDTKSVWEVVAFGGELTTYQPGGTANWDFLGNAPDAYAIFRLPFDTLRGASATVWNTWTPTWDATVGFVIAEEMLPGGKTWSLQVWDDDESTGDEFACDMNELNTPLTKKHFVEAGIVRMDLAGCKKLTLLLICVP